MAELPSCFANVPFLHEHSIERRALGRLEQLRKLKGELAFPIDVETLVELSEGLAVEHVGSDHFDDPEPDRILGAYCFATKTIYINAETVGASTRERWTLAHEYGHHVLHAGFFLQGDLFDQASPKDSLKLHRGKSDPSDKMEWQANQFAAHLLLPREMALAMIEPLTTSVSSPLPPEEAQRAIELLRREAMVSREAARIRLERLKVIPSSPF